MSTKQKMRPAFFNSERVKARRDHLRQTPEMDNWRVSQGILSDDACAQLSRAFPPAHLFQRHENIRRKHGQRPHNRLHLGIDSCDVASIARLDELNDRDPAGIWKEFLEEIKTNSEYHKSVGSFLRAKDYQVRFAWHLTVRGQDVSPHLDSVRKLGTHIFYFNQRCEWCRDWGGETLILNGNTANRMNPEVIDFEKAQSISIRENRSLLFRNCGDCWHGVAPLRSPEDAYRKTFHIIFEKH